MSGDSFQFHFTKSALDLFLDDADHYQMKAKLKHFRTEIRFLFHSISYLHVEWSFLYCNSIEGWHM